MVTFFFQASFQALPDEEIEVLVAFHLALSQLSATGHLFLAPELDSFGLKGFFALLTPMLKQVATE